MELPPVLYSKSVHKHHSYFTSIPIYPAIRSHSALFRPAHRNPSRHDFPLIFSLSFWRFAIEGAHLIFPGLGVSFFRARAYFGNAQTRNLMSHDKTFPLCLHTVSQRETSDDDGGGILQRLAQRQTARGARHQHCCHQAAAAAAAGGDFYFHRFSVSGLAAPRSHSNDVTWKFISSRLLPTPRSCLQHACSHRGPTEGMGGKLDVICHLNKRAGTASLSVLRAWQGLGQHRDISFDACMQARL